MDPFGIVAAVLCSAIGGSIVAGEVMARRHARRLLPELQRVPRVNARRRRDTVLAERSGALGVTSFSIRHHTVRGTMLHLVHAIDTIELDFELDLSPARSTQLEPLLASLSLPPSKGGLPSLTGDEPITDLRWKLRRGWALIKQGIYPLISGHEAAWLVRLLLHPATDEALRSEVGALCHDVKTSNKADDLHLQAWLDWTAGGPTPPGADRALSLLGARAAVAGIASGSVKRARLQEGGLVLDIELAHHPVTDELTTTLDEVERVVRALQPTPDGVARCPSCGDVPLGRPTDAGARPCPGCAGKLLGPADARIAIYEPLGKSPGDLKEAAEGAGERQRTCPLCRSEMAPVFLEEAIVDVCASCGAAWLDEGELGAVSFGRYRG